MGVLGIGTVLFFTYGLFITLGRIMYYESKPEYRKYFWYVILLLAHPSLAPTHAFLYVHTSLVSCALAPLSYNESTDSCALGVFACVLTGTSSRLRLA